MDTGGMGIDTILMAHEEDNRPVTEEESIMRNIHNDLNSVDSKLDWVNSWNNCEATWKHNQNECYVCKVGDLDDEDKFRPTRMG